jgi:hypothetical protein
MHATLLQTLLQILCAVLMVGAVTVTGCDSKGAEKKPEAEGDPAAPKAAAARETSNMTANLGPVMLSLKVPTSYDLSRLGEGDSAQLNWGGSGDSKVDPPITVQRANPAPASLDEAVKTASVGVFVDTRSVVTKEETAERWVVVSKEEPAPDGLGGFVGVHVWTRTEPMLSCKVDVKTKDAASPVVAEALTWCKSLAIKK